MRPVIELDNYHIKQISTLQQNVLEEFKPDVRDNGRKIQVMSCSGWTAVKNVERDFLQPLSVS